MMDEFRAPLRESQAGEIWLDMARASASLMA